MTLLKVHKLVRHFPVSRGFGSSAIVRAVDGVDLEIAPGETLAIVGESGCGKSSLARCVAGLDTATSGKVEVEGTDSADMLTADPMRFRRSIQMVFQDPYSSVNPRRRIGEIIGDGLRLHKLVPRAQRAERVRELLEQVGLAADYADRYPHELSGGQRQRVSIARALAVNPRLIVCDEPVSALDVSVQAQVMNLLVRLQRDHGVAYLFISHDLALVRHIAHKVAVMYLGQVVESGDAAIFDQGFLHPYAQSLFDAAPRIGRPEGEEVELLEGDVPSPISPPSGCRFHTRCPQTIDRCKVEAPDLRPVAGRDVRCHRAEEMLARMMPPQAEAAFGTG
ncbi:ABC transporter ATP-binding protein [Pseudooceanicola nanhaiensis]|uniref:ABC transporter ATP-binding protein n=1 Tax=Pseudooceanicola nanhaiensis TaxID=375761 RepID=UPI001CD7E102|nr:oligopeptide/dipeptide ABC transporter ATP-binding protein [Pseudooceanicola nanhaiensis]MCA0918787.1 ATP-binding cassette domain-containing protein [Pseudooceanicola nanhaiensis]